MYISSKFDDDEYASALTVYVETISFFGPAFASFASLTEVGGLRRLLAIPAEYKLVKSVTVTLSGSMEAGNFTN